MADKEKKDYRKLTIAISTASIVPISTAVAFQSLHAGEQQDDPSANSKELDGSKSYIEEEKKSEVKSDSLFDSVYANRVREEKRAESKARQRQEDLFEHSAKEILLQNMQPAEFSETLPEQKPERIGLDKEAVFEQTVLASVSAKQPALIQQEPEDRVLPVYSAQSKHPQMLLVQGQRAAAEIKTEPVLDSVSESPIQIEEVLASEKDQSLQAVSGPEAEDETRQAQENFLQIQPETVFDASPAESQEASEKETAASALEMEQESQESSQEVREEKIMEAAPLEFEIPTLQPAFEQSAQTEAQESAQDQESAQESIEEIIEEPVMEEMGQPEMDALLNDRIAQAALGLVGTTNGLQCTEVVTEALVQAGVEAELGWPADYLRYGSVVQDPVAGNLVYYDNGGEGADHIAVYVGDGQAVHGNFTTESGSVETVVYDVQYQPEVSPVYIQVEV